MTTAFRFFWLLCLFAMFEGGCKKAAPGLNPGIIKNDTVKKITSPYLGTWKLDYYKDNLMAYRSPSSQESQLEQGRDTTMLNYNGMGLDFDSLVLYKNGNFVLQSAPGQYQIILFGTWNVIDKMLIFDNKGYTRLATGQLYPIQASYYWFITSVDSEELNLVSPFYFVMGSCGDDNHLDKIIMKLKKIN